MDNPIELFRRWLQEAQAHPDIREPSAMSLATCTPDGAPSNRIVLLKQADESGFVFYTNHESRKSRELYANPRAALCFYWEKLDKQVRVEGSIAKVTDEEADIYFASRPHGSQIGSWASQQSQPLASKDELKERIASLEIKYAGITVPRPPHWSGWRLTPQRMEFWIQGDDRLHDRWVYSRNGAGWDKVLLCP